MAAGGEQTRSAHARDVSLGARIVLDVLMIDHPTNISKDCHQTSQIFAQVAVVLTRCLELDGTCMTSTSSIGTEWTTEWAPFLRLAVSVLTTLN